MGDRTFSSNDVLRIFAEHLDAEEQEIVIMFFREPSEIDRAILERLLQLLLAFLTIFTTPLIALAISVLPDVVSSAYNEVVNELRFTNRGLDQAIRSIDA